MAERRLLPVRISWDGYRAIRELAQRETDGNVSEMVRILLSEAVAERHRKARQ